ncbi:30S ribosomal protein S20 [Patescibacteria group bacterium]|nr:30S ribosomal protein S20 [Patescibacteria group bacterium]
MPIKKSAKKSLKQSKVRAKRNLKRKVTMRGLLKQTRELIAEGKKAEAQKLLPQVYKAIDKAARTGVIKKNTAARGKSRITALLNKVEKKEVKKVKSKK